MERRCDWIEKVTGGRLIGAPSDKNLLVCGVSTDTRQIKENQLYVPLTGEKFDGHQFAGQAIERGAAAILWQQDRPLPERSRVPFILVEDTLTALQELAKAYREESAVPVVAVTGSNGKTTTKDLIASVLGSKYQVHKTQGNLNNHIGVPLTLLSMPERAEIAVVEMGMNHAGEIALLSRLAKPDAAVITNIGESHIEYLGSREGIARAKLEIKEGLRSDGPLIFDGDEPLLEKYLTDDTHPHVRIGWGNDMDESPENIEMKGAAGFTFRSKSKKTLFRLTLLGRHNIKNALFAIVVGRHFGLFEEEIAAGLSRVQSTGMRLEMVTAQNGMQIINDAYNASPTSMRAALDLLAELEPQLEKWALLGDIHEIGSLEENYHKELGAYAIQKGISRIYTVGKRGRWISEGAREANRDSARWIQHFASLAEAGEVLNQKGNSGVLLLVKASRAVQLDQVVKNLTEGE
ncbi:UDP-N-acetylmuramoyl-tripeptide--D-alanyl-D-alanine ligase [Paenactinomyces guangxiensis]|nr:UDP-N-acetylmuramoyl-tripeptide--D-alanyl-D-alanine ligase [Paenactinomyces guangxiensis]